MLLYSYLAPSAPSPTLPHHRYPYYHRGFPTGPKASSMKTQYCQLSDPAPPA